MAMIARPERPSGYQPYNAARNNFSGTPREGARSLFGGQKRLEETADWVRRKMGPNGRVGVTAMKVCDDAGDALDAKQIAASVITHNGRDYFPDENGVVRYVDSSAFIPTLKKRIDEEKEAAKLCSIVLAGSDVCKSVFGAEFVEKCKPDTSGQDVTIRGHLIPKESAEANCTPEWLAVWDEGCREWNVGAAKLRMLVKIYRPIILGEAFNWDESAGGGEKNDVDSNGMAAQVADGIATAETS